MRASEAHVESNQSQTASSNEQQQTVVKRSEQAALLFCQVSEGGLSLGEGDPNMEPSCDSQFPPRSWKSNLPSWNVLESSANFTNETVRQDNTYQPPSSEERMKKELRL